MTGNLEVSWLKIKTGDQREFEMLFRSYVMPLCRYADHYLHDSFLAEEIVQDIFLKIWQQRLKIAVDISLKAYLFQMVHHACINALHHQKTKKAAHAILYSQEKWQILEQTLVIDYFLSEDPNTEYKHQLLQKTISELPPQCLEIFTLSRFQDMPASAIAVQLNISINTVRTHIYRAMDKIRTVLSEIK